MTTRSQKKSQSTVNINLVSPKRIENSWVLLVKDSVLENSNFSIITLPHPAHGHLSKYCLDYLNKKLYEVVSFSEPYRSWFMGDYVKCDGSILMITPVNPLFLVLPRLREQCNNRAVPLEDLLSEKGFDKIVHFVTNMNNIGDLKGPVDINAYKYNEEKTLNWLKERIHKLAKVLKEKNIHVMPGAVSATFVASNITKEGIDDEFYLKYAHGIVSEYLQDDLVQKLEEQFNFKPEIIESVGKKRKSEVECANSNKKIKSEPCLDNEIDIKVSPASTGATDLKKKPMSAKEKARQRAASGTKTISAFFTKK
ncbi:unnamed protein product [Parnassius mnemosyne]|uniref:Ribonuclease H2 subunit B n=1 Tax=Parnassius mnemosyne TaxID=213953 RepID=A0AAV1M171_9NEOP